MMLRRLIYPRYSYTEKITFVSKLPQAVYKGECDMKLVEVRESKRRQGEKKKMQMQRLVFALVFRVTRNILFNVPRASVTRWCAM